jgi:hypothetical protein
MAGDIANARKLEHIQDMRSRASAISSLICALICIAIGAFEVVRPHGDTLLVLINYVFAISLIYRTWKWLRGTEA